MTLLVNGQENTFTKFKQVYLFGKKAKTEKLISLTSTQAKYPVIKSLKTINYEGKKKQKQRQRQQRQDITCNINEISKYEI